MAKAAVPLVASVSVCSLLLFLAVMVTVNLACNPTDVYWSPTTNVATTRPTPTPPATETTWSRKMASDP